MKAAESVQAKVYLQSVAIFVCCNITVLAHSEQVVAVLCTQVGVIIQNGHSRHEIGVEITGTKLNHILFCLVHEQVDALHEVTCAAASELQLLHCLGVHKLARWEGLIELTAMTCWKGITLQSDMHASRHNCRALQQLADAACNT